MKSVKATIFMIECGSYSPWSYPGSFPLISQITKMCRWLSLTRLTKMEEVDNLRLLMHVTSRELKI